MNRRAEAANEITGWVPYVVLLVIVFIFLGYAFFQSGVGKAWFESLPVFGQQEGTEGIAILRYDITKDVVQYYDGSKWYGFDKSAIELGSKRVVYSDAYASFKNYFYGNRAPETISVTQSGDYALIQSISSGAVTINLISGDGSGAGSYVLGTDNKLTYLPQGTPSPLWGSAIAQDKVKTDAIAWRDAPLKTPLVISSTSVCATKSDNIYLVVDLSEESTSCS